MKHQIKIDKMKHKIKMKKKKIRSKLNIRSKEWRK